MKELTKVRFTNLDKIVYPKLQFKKSQMIEYYIRIAPKMLEYLAERPVMVQRFPHGIGQAGFYEKDLPQGTPDWVDRYSRYSKTSKRKLHYVVCNDLDTLIWLANLAAIEIHIPLSRRSMADKPDLVLFDLDPEPPASFKDVKAVAEIVRQKLEALGLQSFLKTSGKKGLHMLVPVEPRYNFKQTRAFVHLLGQHLARESSLIVSELSQTREPGTVYIDYLQNAEGRTMISPYSLRGEDYAPASTPLTWDELKKLLNPAELNISTVQARKGNPWEGIWELKQRLEFE